MQHRMTLEELTKHLEDVQDALDEGRQDPDLLRAEAKATRREIKRIKDEKAALLAVAGDPSNEDRGMSAPHEEESDLRTRAEQSQGLRAIARNIDLLSSDAADSLDALVREGEVHNLAARHLASVGDESYLSAFGKWLASPQDAHLRWTPAEHAAWQRVSKVQAEMRAMAIGSGSAGGYLLPLTLDPTLLGISDGVLNPFRRIARVASGVTNEWRGVTADAIVVSRDAEAEEVSDDTPTLGQPVAAATKVQGFVPFSVELDDDWASARSELVRLLVEAKDVEESASFAVGAGDGSTGPQGVVSGATSVASAFDAAGVKGLKQALPPRYQPAARWAFNPIVGDAIFDLVPAGSTSANPLMPSRDANLLGRPWVEASDMTDAVTSGEKPLVIGDFSRFLIYDRLGMQVEVIPHLFGSNQRPTGQRGLYAYWRNTSVVLDANAFRLLTVS